MSDKIQPMENPGTTEGLNNLLAKIYETLQRHEKILVDLTIDVEALKVLVPEDQIEAFDSARETARSAVAFASDRQSRLYAETIGWLRGNQ